MQVVGQVVLIVGQLDVHGQSFAPIGLHKIDAASDWLLMKGLPGVQLQIKSVKSSWQRDFSIYQKEDILFQLKIRDASEKFKNPAAALIKANICQFSSTLLKSML